MRRMLFGLLTFAAGFWLVVPLAAQPKNGEAAATAAMKKIGGQYGQFFVRETGSIEMAKEKEKLPLLGAAVLVAQEVFALPRLSHSSAALPA